MYRLIINIIYFYYISYFSINFNGICLKNNNSILFYE